MKPTEKEIKTALGIIEKLFSLGMDHLTSSSAYQWCRHHEDILNELGIKYGCGATKIVFICDDLDRWVIKMGENFYATEEDVGNSEDFCNYCGYEATLYKEACNCGVGKFFAATYKINEYEEGLVACLQEKTEVDLEHFEDIIEGYLDDLGYDPDDQEDEDRLRAIFGDENKIEELIDFIDSHEINDLHSENYGIKEDGNAVIIDFCGYNEDYSY